MNEPKCICIIGGLGHVGLPLGLSFADLGIKVTLYDIDEEKAKSVSNGEMPFLEIGAEEILKRVLNKTLFVSQDPKTISEAHFVVIVLGTPVDEHLNPDFSGFKKFFSNIREYIHDQQHIILRSTVFPGTTDKIQGYLKQLGKNPKISFCPERIAQGYAIKELSSLPQIVSSCDKKALEEVAGLFGKLTEDIIELKPIEAELSKLYVNVFRYIQFGIANQFYQIATEHGVDWYKVYHSIKEKYPRAEGLPSAGFAAGPCLFKDTMQLAAFSNNRFFLGHAAMLINEGLPNFLVQQLKLSQDLSDKTVGVLGMAFKGNNDDKRDSLSYKLKKILELEAKKVLCSDVYIKDPCFVDEQYLVDESDIVILGATHREYSSLVIPDNKVLVDVWNFFGKGGMF